MVHLCLTINDWQGFGPKDMKNVVVLVGGVVARMFPRIQASTTIRGGCMGPYGTSNGYAPRYQSPICIRQSALVPRHPSQQMEVVVQPAVTPFPNRWME
jgi:hypothetical protein